MERIKAFTVRMAASTHKEFSKKLIDDEMTAQEWFIRKIEDYLKDEKDEE